MAGDKVEDKQTKNVQSRYPNRKVNCRVCKEKLVNKPQKYEEQSICCDCCDKWAHNICAKIDKEKNDAIVKYGLHWYCDFCEEGAASLHERLVLLQTDQANLRTEVAKIDERVGKCEQSDSDMLIRIKACETSGELLELKISELRTELTEKINDQTKTPADPPITFSQLNDDQEFKNALDQMVNTAMIDATKKPNEKRNAWGTTNVPKPTTAFTDIMSDQIKDDVHEQLQIDKLKLNLIVRGIPEQSDDENEDDEDRVTSLIRENLGIEPAIVNIERCGKAQPDKIRPLRLFLSDAKNRKIILQKAKDLRKSQDDYVARNVYINPDLTMKQQIDAKNLRDLLRVMRTQNKDKVFKISEGKVVEVKDQQPRPQTPITPST